MRHFTTDNKQTLTLRQGSEGGFDTFSGSIQHFGWLLNTKINGGARFVAGKSRHCRQIYRGYLFFKAVNKATAQCPTFGMQARRLNCMVTVQYKIINFNYPGTDT